MNKKMVFHFLGRIIQLEAALLLLPLIVSLLYKEWFEALAFLIVAILAFGLGFALAIFFKPQDKLIYAKEGFVITGLSWLFMSAIGALPFVISGDIPNYIDAFFETASGFSTSGATILIDIESLHKGMLFWRSFTHWIGGMGVLVFVMAIVPSICDRSIYVMKAEMPGPVIGKLVPKVRHTALILYLIYIGLTAAETILLLFDPKMNLYDALIHAFGTAGTGGFSTHTASVGFFTPYAQWVITAFMILFGINFNLFYLLLIRRFKSVFRSSELWCFLIIISVSACTIFLNIRGMYAGMGKSTGDAVRDSFFQVASIVSTTGYGTADIEHWPALSKGILVLLMFLGGCAGSTAGGLKLGRVMMLFKTIGKELRKMLHPRVVQTAHFEGKKLDEPTLQSSSGYFALWMVILLTIFLLISFEPFGFEANFTAALTCFNNVGPVFGEKINQSGGFAAYSYFSKIVLSFAMLLGRLEIYPLLFAFIPATWTRKK